MPARKMEDVLTKDEILDILMQGEMDLQGQFVLGSNYTFLVNLTLHSKSIDAVYKPLKGEAPLWDFPSETLAARETAAFVVSEALGWNLVPPTAIREGGPFGRGSLQHFIPHQPEVNYFSFDQETRGKLRAATLFDLIINNADRKGSHIILDEEGHIWLIDHGLCFHPLPKLRTVIWDFSGEKIDKGLVGDLKILSEKMNDDAELKMKLKRLLNSDEISALKARILDIINHPFFPRPDINKRQFPWPLV